MTASRSKDEKRHLRQGLLVLSVLFAVIMTGHQTTDTALSEVLFDVTGTLMAAALLAGPLLLWRMVSSTHITE